MIAALQMCEGILACWSDGSFVGLACNLGDGILLTVGSLLVACTLGVDVLVIGLSMIAVMVDGCAIVCGVGTVACFVGLVSHGGAVVLSKVTCFTFVVFVFAKLLRILSIFSNASICAMPFMFFLPFKACVRSLIALTIVSACVKVGFMMYWCLKKPCLIFSCSSFS